MFSFFFFFHKQCGIEKAVRLYDSPANHLKSLDKLTSVLCKIRTPKTPGQPLLSPPSPGAAFLTCTLLRGRKCFPGNLGLLVEAPFAKHQSEFSRQKSLGTP